MSVRKPLVWKLISTTLVALAFGASSADATTSLALPSTNHIYSIPCETSASLKSVNISDATWSDVGTQPSIPGMLCAYQPAFNPISRKSYFVAGLGTYLYALVEVSTADGAMHVIGSLVTPGVSYVTYPGNVMITNGGVAYYRYGSNIYPLDLRDASLGQPLNSQLQPVGGHHVNDFAACSPISTTCYVLQPGGRVYTIDIFTGIATSLGALPVGDNEGLQVDSNGMLWTNSNSGHLASFDPSDPENSYAEGPSFPAISHALLLTSSSQPSTLHGHPQGSLLASTGTENSKIIGLSFLGLTCVAAGAVLISLRRSTKETPI